MRATRSLFLVLVSVGTLAACGGSGGNPGDDTSDDTGDDTGDDGDDGDDAGPDPDANTSEPDGQTGYPHTGYLCNEPRPSWAPPMPVAPTFNGTCPTLMNTTSHAALNHNTLTYGAGTGDDRRFLVVAPTDIQPGERLPVLVLYHHLNGSGKVYLEDGEIGPAAQSQRFIALLPEAKGDLTFEWPDTGLDLNPARFAEEVKFFDDMIACAAQQFELNMDCISVGGVSAGGLWTPQIGSARSAIVASQIVLSGGTDSSGTIIHAYVEPTAHKPPTIVLWGGAADTCAVVFSFDNLSQDLESHLQANGTFVIECIHNCGHGVPPIDPPPGESKFHFLWDFSLNHPYWLPDGDSPYATEGLPAFAPEWCAIGVGNATERVGVCAPPAC